MTHYINDALPPLVKAVLESRRNGSPSEILKATEELHNSGDPNDRYNKALFHSPGEWFRRRVGRTLFELMNTPTCPLIHEPKDGDHVFVQIEAVADAILQDLAACGMLSASYDTNEDALKLSPSLKNDHRGKVVNMLQAITLDRQPNHQAPLNSKQPTY